MNSYLIEQNFLSHKECDMLMFYHINNVKRLQDGSTDSGWDPTGSSGAEHNELFSGTVIKLPKIDDPLIHNIMNTTRVKTIELIRKFFNIHFNEFLLPSETHLVKWNVGQEMDLHSDTSRESDKYKSAAYEPGYGRRTPFHYTYSGVLYLNDEYKGGETIVDGDIIKPKQGTLVIWDSNVIHGVNKVEDSARYTMPMWFTNLPHFYDWGYLDLMEEYNVFCN